MTLASLDGRELSAAFPGLGPFAEPVRLAGGSLNFVWRVASARGSVVVKRAPPFVASLPHVPLSPRRLLLEAAALRLFDGGPLRHVASEAARPPRLLALDEARSLLVEEDVGDGGDLATALDDVLALDRLGTFVGTLHRETIGSTVLARQFDNADVQRARLETQYARVAELAAHAGADDAPMLGGTAVALGNRLLEPGRCLVMGDLWPASVLPRDAGLRIIDWELAHYGNPAQDVAHLLAHLLIREAIDPSLDASAAISRFLRAYVDAVGSQRSQLWSRDVVLDAGVHLGAELLARAWGPFRVADDHPRARAIAAERGISALRRPEEVDLFTMLQPPATLGGRGASKPDP